MSDKTHKDIHDNYGHIGRVNYLPHYPEEDLYVLFSLDTLPFRFERGEDEFQYGNAVMKVSKRNLWFVYRSDEQYPDLYIDKGFRTLEKAINETLKTYEKELNKELDNLRYVSKYL